MVHKLVFIDRITCKAKKQLDRLSAVFRDQVTAALSKPVNAKRCRPVTHLSRFGVLHFDVSKTLRVSYRKLAGHNCVIHVGTHPEFDKFADQYKGTVSQSILELPKPETVAMTKSNRKPQATKPSSPVLSSGEAKTEVQVLSEMLLECFAKVMSEDRQAMEQKLLSANETLNTHVDKELTSTKQSIDKQKARTDQLRKDLTKSIGKFESACEALTVDYQSIQTQIADVQKDSRQQMNEFAQRADSQHAKVAQTTKRLSESIAVTQRSIESLSRTLSETLSSIQTRADQCDAESAALEDRVSRCEQVGRDQSAKWNAFTAHADQLQAAARLAGEEIAALQEELQETKNRIRELEARLSKRWSLKALARPLRFWGALEQSPKSPKGPVPLEPTFRQPTVLKPKSKSNSVTKD